MYGTAYSGASRSFGSGQRPNLTPEGW